MLNSDHPLNIDHCGKVDITSEHAAMLIFYFFPLIILFVMIVLKDKHTAANHISSHKFEQCLQLIFSDIINSYF